MISRELDRVRNLIELLILCPPRGFSISDYFDKSVEIAGGWGHIHSVSNEFRNADTRRRSIAVDHVKFVGKGTTRNSSQLKRVAHKYGIAPKTAMKCRRDFDTEQ